MMKKENKEFKPETYVAFAVIGVIVLVLIFGSLFTIKAGYRGVILTFGKPSENIAQEGLNFKIPLAQTVKRYEVRTQKIESQADSASLDLQDVQTTIALNFYLDPGAVNKLHQEIGKDYKIRIIDPAIQESVKSVSAQFRAEDLIQRRPEARQKMQELLTAKLDKYHITVKDFNIVNFQFSEEFDKAIEQKVTAEQLKLKADRDLERIRVEAEQVKTQAEAEAYALLLKADAINKAEGVVELKLIEVQEKLVVVQQNAVDKWDGVLPKVTSGIPFIGFDLSGFDKVEEEQV